MIGLRVIQEDERWTFLREARAAHTGMLTEEGYKAVVRDERLLLGLGD